MKLSIIILSYNVEKLLKKALSSFYKIALKNSFQIIVVDNASTDGSIKMVKNNFPEVLVLENKKNVGFAKGNNTARKFVKSENILFLNPDTEVKGRAIEKCLEILEDKKNLGAVACKIVFPDGRIDYSCHRGLPTPWNTFCYWFGFSKMFPKSKFFSGYTASYLDTGKSHFIDCVSGTFIMIRKSILDKVGWWDEDYFWNGEDIELCYMLKNYGYKIWYESGEKIVHYKGSSSGLWITGAVEVPRSTKKRSAKFAAKAMRIFVRKHWKELGPFPTMILVRMGIWVLEKYRLAKIELGLNYAK